jgi:hypothetical protein
MPEGSTPSGIGDVSSFVGFVGQYSISTEQSNEETERLGIQSCALFGPIGFAAARRVATFARAFTFRTTTRFGRFAWTIWAGLAASAGAFATRLGVTRPFGAATVARARLVTALAASVTATGAGACAAAGAAHFAATVTTAFARTIATWTTLLHALALFGREYFLDDFSSPAFQFHAATLKILNHPLLLSLDLLHLRLHVVHRLLDSFTLIGT